jgi:hypothetical protein
MTMRVRIINPLKYMRTRTLVSLGAASLLVLGGCTRAPDDPRTEYAGELSVDGSHEATLTRSLAAGSYLVQVEERDIDLRLVLDAPGIHTEACRRRATCASRCAAPTTARNAATPGCAWRAGSAGPALVRDSVSPVSRLWAPRES